jgi:superfamily II DNA or RNA helicase
MEEYGRGRVFLSDEIPRLVSEVLPALGRRIAVEVATDRLPGTIREPPRIVLDLEPGSDGHALTVLATLVYGDPPRARIDAGRTVPLADGPLPLRDEDAERRLVRRLGEILGLAPGVAETFPGEAGVAFVRRLDRWTGDVRGEGRERFALAPPIRPRIEVGDHDFEVAFEVETDAVHGRGRQGPSATDVLSAWRSGATTVPLPDGGWSPLPADWLSRFGHQVADLLAAREASGRLSPAVLPDLARLCEALDRPAPPAFERLRALAGGFEGLPAVVPPDGLASVLRSYQARGVDWLSFLRDADMGALLADDMGLGKTVQALAAIRGRTLVVAPTSVVANWLSEAARFRPSLATSLYHGRDRSLDPGAGLTVTSYALLRIDRQVLTAVDWDSIVLDESQAIKNPESQVAQAAFDLRGSFRVAMTGTPVENRLDELWSQFHFLNRGLLGGLGDFQVRYARPIADGDVEAAARLRARIRPFVLRRMKAEVAPELPPRTEVVLHAELDDDERRTYDAIQAATRDEVVRKIAAGGSVLAALEALLRLRQAACHRGLVPGQQANRSSKIDVLLEALDNVVAEGHRALVFSQWTSLLDRVEPHLQGAGIPWLRLDGSTTDRGGVVARFQSEDGPPVLLISLRAGGAGLNLTAADHVFLLDPWWNPAVEDQAADRVHRIGQDRPVMIYRLVATDTVEERILELQERKRAIADVATGGGVGAPTLSRDELLALLA